MKYRLNPFSWGLIAALAVILWNLLLFVVLIPADRADEYKRLGYIPTYYAGWPWSDLLLTKFAYAHALFRIQAVLLIAVAINGAILGSCLKWLLGREKGASS